MTHPTPHELEQREGRNREVLQAAERVQAILDSKAFKDAFESVKTSWLTDFVNTRGDDHEGRQVCWAGIQNLNKLAGALKTAANKGKQPAAELHLLERYRSEGADAA